MTPGKTRGLPDLLKWRAPKAAIQFFFRRLRGSEYKHIVKTLNFTRGLSCYVRGGLE